MIKSINRKMLFHSTDRRDMLTYTCIYSHIKIAKLLKTLKLQHIKCNVEVKVGREFIK